MPGFDFLVNRYIMRQGTNGLKLRCACTRVDEWQRDFVGKRSFVKGGMVGCWLQYRI